MTPSRTLRVLAGRQKKSGPSQPPCALGPPGRVNFRALLSPKIALWPLPSLMRGDDLLASFFF
jgi:hypothetical protein